MENVNRTGYLKGARTSNNPYNIIPSGNITTTGMKFPIFANGKLLMPDTGDYKFNTDSVFETPAFNKGGQMRKPKGLKKYSKDTLKMQDGGGVGFMSLLPQAANLGSTLLAPRGNFEGTQAPSMNLANVGNATLAGGKLGMTIGGPLGAGIGAGVAGLTDLTKEAIDFNKNKQDWGNNLKTTRAENRLDYDATHKPYGTRGYMQGTPNEQVYSLFEGGGVGMQDGGGVPVLGMMSPPYKQKTSKKDSVSRSYTYDFPHKKRAESFKELEEKHNGVKKAEHAPQLEMSALQDGGGVAIPLMSFPFTSPKNTSLKPTGGIDVGGKHYTPEQWASDTNQAEVDSLWNMTTPMQKDSIIKDNRRRDSIGSAQFNNYLDSVGNSSSDNAREARDVRGYIKSPNKYDYNGWGEWGVGKLNDGGMTGKKERQMINTQTAITDSYVSHGSVSLSKQDGGKIPTDLNELFDRAMDESGGDETKAEALIQQYQEHPEMIQNKGKKKPQLKKKQHA